MAGHWYSQDGTRIDFVMGAKGQAVTPDIRHARKHNFAPGVTTIIKCAASEALTIYREKQVLMAALTLPRPNEESDEEFVARVMRDSKQHAEDAALAGTALHAEIEHGLGDPQNVNPWVLSARQALDSACGAREWKTEWSTVHSFGFATRADLFSLGDQDWVIDVKTKEGPLDDLKTWDDHHMQLAATASALGLKGARCAILYVRRDAPEARLVEVEQNDIARGWGMFRCLLQFWQTKNSYRPNWALGAGD